MGGNKSVAPSLRRLSLKEEVRGKKEGPGGRGVLFRNSRREVSLGTDLEKTVPWKKTCSYMLRVIGHYYLLGEGEGFGEHSKLKSISSKIVVDSEKISSKNFSPPKKIPLGEKREEGRGYSHFPGQEKTARPLRSTSQRKKEEE